MPTRNSHLSARLGISTAAALLIVSLVGSVALADVTPPGGNLSVTVGGSTRTTIEIETFLGSCVEGDVENASGQNVSSIFVTFNGWTSHCGGDRELDMKVTATSSAIPGSYTVEVNEFDLSGLNLIASYDWNLTVHPDGTTTTSTSSTTSTTSTTTPTTTTTSTPTTTSTSPTTTSTATSEGPSPTSPGGDNDDDGAGDDDNGGPIGNENGEGDAAPGSGSDNNTTGSDDTESGDSDGDGSGSDEAIVAADDGDDDSTGKSDGDGELAPTAAGIGDAIGRAVPPAVGDAMVSPLVVGEVLVRALDRLAIPIALITGLGVLFLWWLAAKRDDDEEDLDFLLESESLR